MIRFFKAIYQFFRCVREVTLSLFFVLFVMVCFAFASLLNSEKHPSTTVQSGALLLDLDGYLADNSEEFGDLYHLLGAELGNEEPFKYSTFDVAMAIQKATTDPNITGIVLNIGNLQAADLPSLRYLGNELHRFKQSGKPVVAVGNGYSQSQYYLASFADKIFLNKAGAVDLHGLSYSNLYFKSLFEKIEAEPRIFRVGTYKSAVEPLIRDDMSPEAKQNANLWLNGMWQNVQNQLAENRQIAPNAVLPEPNELIARYKKVNGDDAQYALSQGLVTEIATESEMIAELAKLFGKDEENGFQAVSYDDYFVILPNRFESDGKHKIAVVNVEGEITMGESSDSTAGSETIVRQLQAVKKDKNVQGLILRVNSPGGSAVASELIRQEVEAIQQQGIPVVASMGGMAASGGYWISATSDKIIADPNTLTGSIGIFGVTFNLEKTAKNLGVKEDGIATSELANATALKPLTATQSELIQISIENGYDRFLELVSRGRKMPKSAVDSIAQGQVWLGKTALENGLVDKLGDFQTAYDELRGLINTKRQAENQEPINDFTPQWFIEQDDSLLAELNRSLSAKMQLKLANVLGLELPTKAETPMAMFRKFNDPKQSYLYCLNCGSVK